MGNVQGPCSSSAMHDRNLESRSKTLTVIDGVARIYLIRSPLAIGASTVNPLAPAGRRSYCRPSLSQPVLLADNGKEQGIRKWP